MRKDVEELTKDLYGIDLLMAFIPNSLAGIDKNEGDFIFEAMDYERMFWMPNMSFKDIHYLRTVELSVYESRYHLIINGRYHVTTNIVSNVDLANLVKETFIESFEKYIAKKHKEKGIKI